MVLVPAACGGLQLRLGPAVADSSNGERSRREVVFWSGGSPAVADSDCGRLQRSVWLVLARAGSNCGDCSCVCGGFQQSQFERGGADRVPLGPGSPGRPATDLCAGGVARAELCTLVCPPPAPPARWAGSCPSIRRQGLHVRAYPSGLYPSGLRSRCQGWILLPVLDPRVASCAPGASRDTP